MLSPGARPRGSEGLPGGSLAGIAGPSRWAAGRFLGGGVRAEQPATSFHGWAVQGASGGLAVLGFACGCGSRTPSEEPLRGCEVVWSWARLLPRLRRGRVVVVVVVHEGLNRLVGVAALTTLTLDVCAKTEGGPGIKWETASEFSITPTSQACVSSWPLNGLHALQRLWTSWGHDECFDL